MIYTVPIGGLAAVVSDSAAENCIATRENLLAHQKTVERVMEKYPLLLPVSFGVIIDNERLLKDILKNNHKEFKTALDRLEGKTEIGLKVFWLDLNTVLKEIAQASSEIKKLQSQVKRLGPLNRLLAMRAGNRVAGLLAERRKYLAGRILAPLKAIAEESKDSALFSDQMIVNSAFLVKKDKLEYFDKSINKIMPELGENIKIKYFGPAPPSNFVNLRISADKASSSLKRSV